VTILNFVFVDNKGDLNRNCNDLAEFKVCQEDFSNCTAEDTVTTTTGKTENHPVNAERKAPATTSAELKNHPLTGKRTKAVANEKSQHKKQDSKLNKQDTESKKQIQAAMMVVTKERANRMFKLRPSNSVKG